MERKPDIENITKVWERVTGTANRTPRRETDDKRLMRDAMASAADLNSIYGFTVRSMRPGRARSIAETAMNEARTASRRMESEYFILTGDTYYPGSNVRPSGGTAGAVRELYRREEKIAEMFSKYSRMAESRRLRTLFGELSAAGKSRSARMLALTKSMVK